ncbi:hypothetical protein [Paenibacillus roseipurpureus]|uniref:Uncharacterized protein n=1 Tax=Paenibacillus roseopurpureus TaxID=2918901 RepID=A0AA96LKC1_9BACL|nr:hypothetical protein [Paenibacillus sp. MBLB1832]WNR42251.1 hypothetical protein MJB10_14005 [Paenibacillus sp. MBLB1832]
MRRFLYNENGAVSVYLILIIVPIFLFQAVLIDFARIQVAEAETESAVQAAARSVMSSFDLELQKRGLYGMGLTQEAAIQQFNTVFESNLSGGITSKAFHFINNASVKDTSRVTPVYSLASHVIFENQLLQDMKLKAPITYTLEIVDKFKKSGVREPFQSGAQFVKDAEEIERLIDQREDALDEAWRQVEVLHAKLTAYHSYYHTRLSELDNLAAQIGLHTLDDVRGEMTRVQEDMQSLYTSIQNVDASISSLSKTGKEAAERVQSLLDAKQVLESQLSTLSQKFSDLDNLLKTISTYSALLVSTKLEMSANEAVVSQLQQAIEPAIRKAKLKNDEIRTKLTGISAAVKGDDQGARAVFSHVSLIADTYFDQYQTSVAGITALFGAFRSALEGVYLFTSETTNKLNQANEAYWGELNSFYQWMSPLEHTRMGTNSDNSVNKHAQKNKIQALLDQAKAAIGGCSVTNMSNGDSVNYEKLQGVDADARKEQGLYQKYRQLNAQDETIGSDVAYELNQAEPFSMKAMDILSAINQAGENLRNELYVNEFALSKFNYRTYGQEKESSGQPKLSHERFDPSTHPLANQEVEYLLYGFSSCVANMSSAYAEMYALRLAVRTLEALLDPRKELLNIGSPLLVFLACAAEGAVAALQDMNALVKGEAVELSSKLSAAALKLTYKDYLRLFLLLHSNNEKLMARMQALIELETGKDLQQETAYVQTNATSEIKLWFIPKLMKLLDESGLLGCKVVGSTCQFNRTAIVSY